MRISSLAVVAFVSSIALVGCGSDDSGGITKTESETETTVAEDTGSSDRSDDDRETFIDYVVGADATVIDDEQGECVADAAFADFSDEGMEIVNEGGEFDLEEFSADDAQLIVDGLDECVDIGDALAAFSEGISSEAGLPITEEEAACTSEEFAAEYSGAGSFIEAISAMSDDESGAKLFEAMAPCMSDETAIAFMSSLLVGQEMDQALADCVAEGVVGELGAAGLLEAIASAGASGDSEALNSASENAGAACAAQGLGMGDATIPGVGGGIGNG